MISPQKFVFGRKVKCITRGLVQPAQNVLENPEKDWQIDKDNGGQLSFNR